jgi:hypothetical protein
MLVGGEFYHVGGNRSDQAIAQKNSQERTYKGRGNLLADFFGRPAHRAHCDHDAKHGSDNAQAG